MDGSFFWLFLVSNIFYCLYCNNWCIFFWRSYCNLCFFIYAIFNIFVLLLIIVLIVCCLAGLFSVRFRLLFFILFCRCNLCFFFFILLLCCSRFLIVHVIPDAGNSPFSILIDVSTFILLLSIFLSVLLYYYYGYANHCPLFLSILCLCVAVLMHSICLQYLSTLLVVIFFIIVSSIVCYSLHYDYWPILIASTTASMTY